MARYIDVENFPALFDEEFKKTRELILQGETHLDNLAEGFLEADRVIRNIPTADVVPREEFEKIFEEIEAEITAALKSNYEARSVYNPTDEFGMWVQGKIDALRGIEDFIAELKKKYIGDKR
jgi:hypothetical protein